MLVALALLLVALIFVLIKDWRSLEAPTQVAETESAQPVTPEVVTPAPPVVATAPTRAPQHAERQRNRTKSHKAPAVTRASSTEVVTPVITATNRAILPPLQVEVVAGGQHRPVSTADPSVNVEMRSGTTPFSQPAQAPPDNTAAAPMSASNAAERVQLSPGTAQIVSRPVDPTYPLLAKQMKVQGAVILQALVSKSGSIQEIQVLSGPAILSAAAREAVRQWKFKPYLQSGRAVETEARITVNFTISTY